MILARREFLKLLGLAAGAGGLAGCTEWSVPDRLIDLALRGPGIETHKNTLCGLCQGGCGLTVRLVDGLPVGLKGNPRYPLNRGGLCPVGQAGLEVLYAPGRVRGPLRRGADGEHHPTTWEESIEDIATHLNRVQSAGAGHRIVFLLDEPSQLLFDLVQRFAHALGSPNVARPQDGLSLPYRLTQGVDTIPGFDLERSDLVLAFGLDLYEDGPAPVHAITAMVGSRPTERRGALLHVGTRLSPSGAKAEEHVPVRPGTHGALALGVAHVLVREGNYDRQFVANHTFGFESWQDDRGRRRLGFHQLLLERYYPDRAAQLCGCEPQQIIGLARRFAAAANPIAVVGGEAISGSNATWTAMAVHALNALVGAFDRPGGVLQSPTIPLTPLDPLPPPPTAPELAVFAVREGSTALGIDPVEALADGVLDGSHPIEALFVLNSNPVHASPVGTRFRQALDHIPLVVALAPFRDETASAAHFILPTHVPMESWQESTTPPTVGFSILGLAEPVIEPLFDTRHAGDSILEIARYVGGSAAAALPWRGFVDYLKHRLGGLVVSGEGSVISGSFEESWVQFLEERGWRFLEHTDIDEFWQDLVKQAGWWNPMTKRGDRARLFPTASGRFEFFSTRLEQHLRELGRRDGDAASGDVENLRRGIAAVGLVADVDEACLPHYEPPIEHGDGEITLVPFKPITARGQLGTVSPMVLEMFGYSMLSGWQTWVELAPATAHELDLEDGDHIDVESERGAVRAVVRVARAAVPGVGSVALGLGHRRANADGNGVGANPFDILVQAHDGLTGNLSLTSSRVHLRLVRRRPHGGPAPFHGAHG